MKRRHYLAMVGAAGVGGTAGCLDAPQATSDAASASAAPELPVPESDLTRGAPRDGIPAITEPAFGDDWSGIEITIPDGNFGAYETRPRLAPDDRVIGVARDGEARAYPLAILDWHEVVNDIFEPGSKARRAESDGAFGGPLLVTFCPLCGSGLVAERMVGGEETIFGVSGLLYDSNLVLYDDATESLWSQLLATAIRGPATGETLDLLPSTLTTLGAWREEYPETKVLLPSPRSKTVRGEVIVNYTREPYRGYDSSRQIGIGDEERVAASPQRQAEAGAAGLPFDDDPLHPKAAVLGVTADGVARAYPLEALGQRGVVNDRVGDLPVVVAVGPDDTLVAYDRRVGGTSLEFAREDAAHLRADGSRWRTATGEAIDGPHEGSRLRSANDRSPMFWFAWLDLRPETDVYGS